MFSKKSHLMLYLTMQKYAGKKGLTRARKPWHAWGVERQF